jgi:Carboxypeptidase regulatory-like domain/TonB-dependent Receptor Plug Domain
LAGAIKNANKSTGEKKESKMLIHRILKLTFSFLLIYAAAWAQTSGGMRGEIRDQDGQPLPGVTVTISSAALIGTTRTTTTNELGVFRFPSLPVGTYKVEAGMQGFETIVSDNITVGLGATANVPLTMKMTAVTESLTVEAETPLLDVNQSGLSTSYKKEILEEVPTQRTMWDLMQVSPGMSQDYGDNQSANFVAFGSSRQSNSWNIDGVDVTGPETGKAWWYVNPDVIEEIQVLGVGAPAEYGNFT